MSTRGDTISLRPVADTTLQEAFPDNNLGAGSTLTSGGRRQGGATRALMLFDIAGNLPAGATINSASLTVTVVSTPSGGANSIFDLKPILAAWGEGDGSDRFGGSPAGADEATWNDRLGPSTPWTTPGGDFSATASASRFITANGSYTFDSTPNLVGDVQGWLNNPANNSGWVMLSESESTPVSIRRFASRDDLANSPVLLLQFSVPEPSEASLLALGCGLVGWSSRRGRRER